MREKPLKEKYMVLKTQQVFISKSHKGRLKRLGHEDGADTLIIQLQTNHNSQQERTQQDFSSRSLEVEL